MRSSHCLKLIPNTVVVQRKGRREWLAHHHFRRAGCYLQTAWFNQQRDWRGRHCCQPALVQGIVYLFLKSSKVLTLVLDGRCRQTEQHPCYRYDEQGGHD